MKLMINKYSIVSIFFFLTFFANAKEEYLYTGKINNKYSIVLKLEVDGNTVDGSYMYLSSFIPITFEGTLRGNKLRLSTAFGNQKGEVFEGVFSPTSFSGIWTSEQGKSLPFKVTNSKLIINSTDKISGAYHYELSQEDIEGLEIPKGENGPVGSCNILLLSNGNIGFHVTYCKGYPGYHIGELSGIAIPSSTTNKFIYKDNLYGDTSDDYCILEFQFEKDGVQITQKTSDMNCGFGAFVYIDNLYNKQSNYPNFSKILY